MMTWRSPNSPAAVCAGIVPVASAAARRWERRSIPHTLPLTLELLEPRYFFSATNDIALIDRTLVDAQELINAALVDTRVITFDGSQESAEDVLGRVIAKSGGRKIGSLAVYSHGSAGRFALGNEWIDAGTLQETENYWRQLGELFDEDATLQIYGCDTADGVSGQKLLNRLAKYTGASVFGSTNITGRDGDWTLEKSDSSTTTNARVQSVLKLSALSSYAGQLATVYFDANGIAPINGGSGTWDTTSPIWTNATASVYGPWNNGDDAVFNWSPGTVTLAEAISAGSLTFNNSGYVIDLNGNSLTQTGVSVAGLISTITNTGGLATYTINTGDTDHPRVTGNVAVTYNGAGTWVPTAGSDFTGPLLRAGTGTTLTNEGSSALCSSSGTITLSDSAGITFSGPTQFQTYGRDFVLNGASHLFGISGVRAVTLTGAISGTGALNRWMTQGALILAGNNSYSGATTLTGAGGALVLAHDNALGNTTGVTVSVASTLGFSGGINVGAIPLTHNGSLPTNGFGNVFSFDGVNRFAGNITGTGLVRGFGAAAGSSLTLTGNISHGWGISKIGEGTLVLTGANTFGQANTAANTNGTFLSNGTLLLDFSQSGVTTNIINNQVPGSFAITSNRASHLVLAGGALVVKGSNGATNLQQFTNRNHASGAFTINPGASTVQIDQNGATSVTLDLGRLASGANNNRKVGGTVNFILPTLGMGQTGSIVLPGGGGSTGSNGAILVSNGSAFATVDGIDWAALDAAGNRTIVAGSSIPGFYTANGAGSLSGNADMSAGLNTTLGANATLTSLRFHNSGARGIDIGGNILTTGGILVTETGNGLASISNGTLRAATGAANQDLVIIQDNVADKLTIGASIVDNTSASALTKTGAGILELAAANTYSGVTTVTEGLLYLNHAAALPGGLDNTVGASESGLLIKGGVVGLTGDFSRALQTGGSMGETGTSGETLPGAGLVRWNGSGGFAAYGGDRTVSISTSSADSTPLDLVWGGSGGASPIGFVPSQSALILGADDADGTLIFANNIDLDDSNGQGWPTNREIQVNNGSAAVDARISGIVQGGMGITKTGDGTLEFTNDNTYEGPTIVEAGTLIVNGSMSTESSVTINSGATLRGSGSIGGSVTIDSGAILSPGSSPGILDTGDFTLNAGSTLEIEIEGDDAGTDYDQINVTGSVDLGGATLDLSGARTVNGGVEIVIVNNDGTDAVTGTFAGLAEGDSVVLNGVTYTISYEGGTGNDVVLTDAAPTVATAADASATTVTTTTTNLSVLGASSAGEGTLTYTWAATTKPAGSNPLFSANGTNAAKNSTVTFDKEGEYTFTVTISNGTFSVTSEVDVTLELTVTTIDLGPSGVTINLNDSQQFTATGYDQFGDLVATPDFTWSEINGIGDVDGSGLYTADDSPGTATVRVSAGASVEEIDITVVNDSPVNTTPAAQTTNEDSSRSFSAAGGNAITIADDNSSVTVTLTATNGTLSLGDLAGITIVGGADGSDTIEFTGSVAQVNSAMNGLTFMPDANHFGAASVQIATSAGGLSDSDTVTITVNSVNDAPTVATPADALALSNNGKWTTLSSLGDDDGGEASLTYTWSAANMPAGASSPDFEPNGTNAAKSAKVTFSKAGTYRLRVTISDGEFSVTSDVDFVVDQLFDAISISAYPAIIGGGNTQQFAAVGVDQFSDALVNQPAISWSLVSGVGSITSGGNYASSQASGGAVTVRADAASDKSATASFNVIPTVIINPPPTPPPVHVDDPSDDRNEPEIDWGDGGSEEITPPPDPIDPTDDTNESYGSDGESNGGSDDGGVSDNPVTEQPPAEMAPEQPIAPPPAQEPEMPPPQVQNPEPPIQPSPEAQPAPVAEAPSEAPAAPSDNSGAAPAVVVTTDGGMVAPATVEMAQATVEAFAALQGREQVVAESQAAEAQATEQKKQQQVVTRVAATVTAGAVAGYMVWLVQGGSLLISVVSTMPFWRWLDPLPVLDSWSKANEARRARRRSRWRRKRKDEERELEGIVD